LSVYETPRPEQLAWLFGLGGCAVLGQYLMTRGYGVAPASVVSSLNLLNAAFSALTGWIFFGESLAWAQWLGMGLMVAGIVAVALQAAPGAAHRLGRLA
jgi:drug/metabolite transporter (DMT)-like permease